MKLNNCQTFSFRQNLYCSKGQVVDLVASLDLWRRHLLWGCNESVTFRITQSTQVKGGLDMLISLQYGGRKRAHSMAIINPTREWQVRWCLMSSSTSTIEGECLMWDLLIRAYLHCQFLQPHVYFYGCLFSGLKRAENTIAVCVSDHEKGQLCFSRLSAMQHSLEHRTLWYTCSSCSRCCWPRCFNYYRVYLPINSLTDQMAKASPHHPDFQIVSQNPYTEKSRLSWPR